MAIFKKETEEKTTDVKTDSTKEKMPFHVASYVALVGVRWILTNLARPLMSDL